MTFVHKGLSGNFDLDLEFIINWSNFEYHNNDTVSSGGNLILSAYAPYNSVLGNVFSNQQILNTTVDYHRNASGNVSANSRTYKLKIPANSNVTISLIRMLGNTSGTPLPANQDQTYSVRIWNNIKKV